MSMATKTRPGVDVIRDDLVRGFLIELLDDFSSLSISAREAVWRRNDALAACHVEQLRLVGREVVRTFRELEIGGQR